MSWIKQSGAVGLAGLTPKGESGGGSPCLGFSGNAKPP